MKLRSHKISILTGILLGGFLVLGKTVEACSACYGKVDPQIAESVNWGIFTMLGLIGAVLWGIGAFIWHLNKCARFARETGVAMMADQHDNF
jgi:hypothetical protein